ncbi:hypothetical protein MASR1M42_15190 [Azonexus hydrophilus]
MTGKIAGLNLSDITDIGRCGPSGRPRGYDGGGQYGGQRGQFHRQSRDGLGRRSLFRPPSIGLAIWGWKAAASKKIAVKALVGGLISQAATVLQPGAGKRRTRRWSIIWQV